MVDSDKKKLELYVSYQVFEQSIAGRDFLEFLNKEKETAIDLCTTKDDAEARGRYQFIKRFEKRQEHLKTEAIRIQQKN